MKRFCVAGFWPLVIFVMVGGGFLAGQARAEGYISGTVRDGGGNPLPGIFVDAFEVNFGHVSTGCVPPRPLETKVTNASGQYGFCVWNGIYKVYFRGQNPYVGRWNGSSSYSGATPVVIREGQELPINGTLYTTGGAQLSGKVTGPDNTGLAGVNVTVFDFGQTVESRHGLASATTDGNGDYAISAPLALGSYKVKCNDQTADNNHLPEWWNDKTDISPADALLLTSEGPNRADCKLSNGGIISGRVINSVLLPVAYAVIGVYDAAGKLANSTISTDTEGYYTARRLRTGDYKVLFKGPFESSLAYEWYSNQPFFSLANWVPVVAGATTGNINARLLTGGAISGFITDGTVGISGVVRVYDTSGSLAATGFSEATGNYFVDGLPAGMYKVELARYDKRSLWYKFGRTSADAAWVMVNTGGVTSGINGILSPAAVISGTVTDPQGRGIPRVTVRTYDDATQEPLSCQDGTDSLGEYTVRSLSPGATRVFFDSRGTGYFPEWWDDKKSAAEAVAIQLAAGATYPDRDAQLGLSREVYFPLLLHK